MASSRCLHSFESPTLSNVSSAPTWQKRVDSAATAHSLPQELSGTRTVDVGDREVDLEPSYLVKSKTARVKLASMFGKDKVTATVDYGMDDASTTYEVGYAHSIEDGRSVTATVKPASTDLAVEYVDSTFEDGAVWTASANLKTDDPTSLDKATVSLKRSWDW